MVVAVITGLTGHGDRLTVDGQILEAKERNRGGCRSCACRRSCGHFHRCSIRFRRGGEGGNDLLDRRKADLIVGVCVGELVRYLADESRCARNV